VSERDGANWETAAGLSTIDLGLSIAAAAAAAGILVPC